MTNSTAGQDRSAYGDGLLITIAGTLEWTCAAATGHASERSSAETELGYR